jgi:NAD(P)-dependent dehydrogenase (short-subunit alcohol dehydrogenase family)
MLMKASQKVVLITGASTGIGRATAILLASKGYKVFGGVRSPDRVQPLPGVELVRVDVRDDISVKACVDDVLGRSGRIDVLVNNAGYSLVGAVEETTIEQAQGLFDTNLFGIMRMIRAVLPAMRQAGLGLIVNVSSIAGFLPVPFMGLYASSKHAVEGLSESLDHEVRGFGIRVAVVEPGFTNTPIDTNSQQAEEPVAVYSEQSRRAISAIIGKVKAGPPPESVAETILKSIEKRFQLRHPAGREAGFLTIARRFMPATMVDRTIHKEFNLA